MPPKSRKVPNSDTIVEDSEDSFTSVETASASSYVTSEQLEKILEANHRSMAALISTLASASLDRTAPPRVVPVGRMRRTPMVFSPNWRLPGPTMG